MSKRIQRLVASILSALLIPLFCFAVPTFGMPLIYPPVAACDTQPSVSGVIELVSYAYPTDPIQRPNAHYCMYNTPARFSVENDTYTSGMMY